MCPHPRLTSFGLSALLLGLIVWPAALVAAPQDLPALTMPSVASTTDAPVLPDDSAEIQQTYQKALELERNRQWPAAIEAYEEALKRWPGHVEFRHRLRLCESHYRLGRRYRDKSFREVLVRMPREQVFELYSEVIDRIEGHYVEPVALAPLLRRGLDNLEVALRDPAFLNTVAPNADRTRVMWLRQRLTARRNSVVARNRAEAMGVVSESCDLARQALGIDAAPIVLEFAYGACDALPDDYSTCLTPEKLDDLFSVIDGNFVGLGVELKGDSSGLKLVGVIPGGPAAEAGLKVGERITHVGGEALAGLELDAAASKLQGPEGSQIHLVVVDASGQGRSLALTRREIEVPSVSQAKIVDPAIGVGYVKLDGFQKSSTDELRRAIAKLQGLGMRYLVLDLRGNPGGLLDVSVEIADEFLDSGVIVSTRGRARNQNAVYRANPGGAWRSLPVVVLVDRDSASASEILAGALKDNGRAVVLGEKSFGKGSVQSIFPLRAAPAGLKLTTAKFYSPRNRAYSEQGVEPDVRVRVAAKPADPDTPSLDLPSYGDPSSDPALESAIALVGRQVQPTR